MKLARFPLKQGLEQRLENIGSGLYQCIPDHYNTGYYTDTGVSLVEDIKDIKNKSFTRSTVPKHRNTLI